MSKFENDKDNKLIISSSFSVAKGLKREEAKYIFVIIRQETSGIFGIMRKFIFHPGKG